MPIYDDRKYVRVRNTATALCKHEHEADVEREKTAPVLQATNYVFHNLNSGHLFI